MNRNEVYLALDSERDFQIKTTADSARPDMNPEMSMGDLILAMRINLEKAEQAWYRDNAPYTKTMDYIRKVAGLAVQAGEKYDMPYRIETY